MTTCGFQLRQPSGSELVLVIATLCFVAVIYTGLHYWLHVNPDVLRKSFFMFGTALLLGPFGISPRQSGWRVLPVYFALALFAVTAL